MHFWISDLARAVALFSKNVHDESLPTSIQTMSCKLLLNLVECIKDRSHKENAITNGRELLMRMNEVFVQKFKTVAKLQLVSTQWPRIWKKVQFKEAALLFAFKRLKYFGAVSFEKLLKNVDFRIYGNISVKWNIP